MTKQRLTLAQIAEKLGVGVEDLELDELTAHQAQLQSAQQTLATREQELNIALQYAQSLQVQQQTAARQQSGSVPDWMNDPIFSPIAAHIQKLEAALEQNNRQFGEFQRRALEFANNQEISRLRATYKDDFDSDRVRKYAQQHNHQGSWEDVYHAEKATRMDDIIKAREEAARKAGMEEAEKKLTTSRYEMGDGGGQVPDVQSKPKSYDSMWDGLAKELSGLGMQ